MEYQVAAREVGDSLFIISDLRRLRYRTLRALESHNRRQPKVVATTTTSSCDDSTVGRSAGSALFLTWRSWGSASLHPRLYAIARYRGLRKSFWVYVPGVALRSTPGFTRNHLGKQYDLKHFTPKYNPWDQRLCLVPDSDLFNAILDGRATVVTDHIDAFTERGLQLKSGERLDADIVLTATGLLLKLMSGLQLTVDGAPVDCRRRSPTRG